MRNHYPHALLLLGLTLPLAAQAQDVTNSGGTITLSGGATFFVPGNFNNTNSATLDLSNGANNLQVNGNLTMDAASALVPGSASTVTLGGTAAQTLDLNGKALANLTINNTLASPTVAAPSISVPSAASVSGALTLTNGLVRVAPATTLTLLNGATLTGEQNGRYVAGPLAAQDNSLTAGPNAFPNSLTVSLPAAQAGTLTVTRTAGLSTAQLSYGTNAGGGNPGIDRIWSSSGPLPAGATVTLGWISDNDDGLTGGLSSARLWARTAAPVAGSPWTPVGSLQDASASRQVSGTLPTGSSFQYFTASTNASPLPVTLVAFTAERQGTAALLRWRTASEVNNDRFEVETSTDGLTFRKIGQVAGRGTAVQPSDYQFGDPALLTYAANPVYYRLRQVDTDGKANYSVVRAVQVEAGPLPFAASVAPNPVGPAGTTLHLSTPTAGPVTLTVYDMAGRLVLSQRADAPAGGSTLALPQTGGWATGAYTAHLVQGPQHATLKLVHE